MQKKHEKKKNFEVQGFRENGENQERHLDGDEVRRWMRNLVDR